MNASHTLTQERFARSVMAVPPLARTAGGAIDPAANERIVRHIESGGVSLLLYGGNANVYHLPLDEYEPLLAMLSSITAPSTIAVPSAGPTYGLLMEHAKAIRRHRFPTVMVLPQQGITSSAGVATGIRRFVEAAGVPALVYVKHEGYLDPADLAGLCRDGLVTAIKYATVRDDPAHDPYLRELVEVVDPATIISGIGEQPAIVHLRNFRLGGFTTGCGCIAPRLSQRMLAAIRGGRWEEAESIRAIFEPLEDLRNGISPIRVLHEAVAAAGIADTGPILPLLSNVEEGHRPAIASAARSLLQSDH